MKTQLLLFFCFSIVSIMFSQEEPLPPPIEVVAGPYDIEPTFPGGQEALMRFIHTNITYPESAFELGLKARCMSVFMLKKMERFQMWSY